MRKTAIAAVLTSLSVWTAQVGAGVVFSDNFESGDVVATDNTADGDGVSGTLGWDRSFSSGSSTFAAINDGTLGNSALLDNKGDQTFGFFAAAFAEQTLSTTGDSLTLTFDFRFTTGPTDSSGGSNLRFGFWDSGQDINDSDGSGTGDTLAYGHSYWTKASTQSTATKTAIFEDADGAPGWEFNLLSNSTNVGALVDDQAKYSAVFALEKTASGVSISVEFFNSIGGSIESLSFEDTVSPFMTFDAIAFRTRNADNIAINNVVVDFTAAGSSGGDIPEPASLTMLGLGGLLLARRRINRTT